MDILKLREQEFEVREKHLKNARFQELVKTEKSVEKLEIVYVMTWTNLCGGSKIILEQANRLSAKGHNITIISHFPKPDWCNINENVNFIQVPWTQTLCEVIQNCDIIVATYWREIYECIEQKKAPVIYFEQGDSHLFDSKKLDERTLNYIKKQFEVVPFIYTVSNYAKDKIKELYKRDSVVIPNAVDDEDFYVDNTQKNDIGITVSMIGSENSDFKGINKILEAIQILKNENYNINVNWITPDKPKKSTEKCYINVNSKNVGKILRNSSIFVCASKYESFGLPILEAMKCGLAIITTDTGGNRDFVKNNENSILTDGTPKDIASKIKMLCEDEKLRNKLIKNAILTSKQYNWDLVIDKIENYYKKIAQYIVK